MLTHHEGGFDSDDTSVPAHEQLFDLPGLGLPYQLEVT